MRREHTSKAREADHQTQQAGLARRIGTQNGAYKHRAVVAAADDLQAVVAELNAGHGARVPPQRALLLMAQPRTSAQVHAAANDTPSQTTTRTSFPLCASHIFTVLSRDPLTMCLPSGEKATDQTGSECPVSVHFC